MATKSSTSTKRSAPKKKAAAKGTSEKNAEAFYDHLRGNTKLKASLRRGWAEVIAEGKKKGFKFNKQELRDHLMKRYKITVPRGEDEPDTCFCI